MELLKTIYRITSNLFIDPLLIIRKIKGLIPFLRNLSQYKKIYKSDEDNFILKIKNIYPILGDRFEKAGIIDGHYFLQDLWAAKKIFEKRITFHVDVGSRIDGFIAHILPFCKVEYVDIRDFTAKIKNFDFKKGSILDLPYTENSINSISCLHVLEHIGLGRYGDNVIPDGYKKGASELTRVLSKGGFLFFSTPVGLQQLYFNAHRVFDPQTIIDLFKELKLEEFNLIDDKAMTIKYNASFKETRECKYGCGLFIFTKC